MAKFYHPGLVNDMRSFYLVASAFLNFLIFAYSRHLIFGSEFQARRLNLHLISTSAYDPRLKYAKNYFQSGERACLKSSSMLV